MRDNEIPFCTSKDAGLNSNGLRGIRIMRDHPMAPQRSAHLRTYRRNARFFHSRSPSTITVDDGSTSLESDLESMACRPVYYA